MKRNPKGSREPHSQRVTRRKFRSRTVGKFEVGAVFLEEGVQVAWGSACNVLYNAGDLCAEARFKGPVELQPQVGVPLRKLLEEVRAADVLRDPHALDVASQERRAASRSRLCA